MLYVLPEKSACFELIMFANKEKFFLKTLNAYDFQLTTIDKAGKSRVVLDPAPQVVAAAIDFLSRDRKNEFFFENGAPADGCSMLCATDYDKDSLYAVIQRVEPRPQLYGTRLSVTAFSELAALFHARKPLLLQDWEPLEQI